MNTKRILDKIWFVNQLEIEKKKARKARFIHGNICWGEDTCATDEDIFGLEQRLKFSLHPDFKEFAKNVGFISIPQDGINGLLKASEESPPIILEETERFRREVSCAGSDPLTVMHNEDGEWYVLMNHENGLIVYYDPFSKSYTDRGERTTLEEHSMKMIDEQARFVSTRNL